MKGRFIVALAVVAIVVTGLVLFNPLTLLPAAEVESGPPPRETAQVLIEDLEIDFEATEGSLEFLDQMTVNDPQSGVVGWIVDAETVVEAGDVLYERDQQPVVLFDGQSPAWRTMSIGDVGQDVAQLESNLLALGYGTEAEFTVDDTFTSATAVIVERWQADLGGDETGSVAQGDVVFGPAPARVGTVTATVGSATDAGPILVLSSMDRELVFTISAATVENIGPGSTVDGRLPDRSTIAGTVTEIVPAGSGFSRVDAALIIDEGTELPAGDSIPVTVTWSDVQATDALTVAASALLRLDQGGYAVEVVDEPGHTVLVPVTVGVRYASRVQILDGLEPQSIIVAP